MKLKMIELKDDTFSDFVMGDGVRVVDFWAEWCGPCKMLTPILEELDAEIDGLHVGKMDADEFTQTASAFGVVSIPTVLVFKGGELVGQQVGAKPKALMKKFLENYL